MAAENHQNTLKWTEGSGRTNPSPDAVLMYNEKTATVLSWGAQMSVDRPIKYTGIGEYTLPMSRGMKEKIKGVENAILKNPTDKPATDSKLLLYRFIRCGISHKGFYNFGKIPTSLISELYPAIDVYRHVLSDGKPIVSFYPSLVVKQIKNGFHVDLNFKNTGRTLMILSGPFTWTDDAGMLPEPKVEVEGWSGETEFSFLLTRQNLVDGKDFSKEIMLPSGKSVTLGFDVPYTDIAFDESDVTKHIGKGSYTFAGDMKIDILAPKVMKGRVATAIDFVKDVRLHGQP